MIKDFYSIIKKQAQASKWFAEIKDENLSYKELLIATQKTVSFLRTFSLIGHARVIISTQHDKELIILVLSCLFEGICPILLAPDTTPAKLKHITELSHSQLIFMDQNNVDAIDKSINAQIIPIKVTKKKRAFVNKILGTPTLLTKSYPELLNSHPPLDPKCETTPKDIALIVFTSGSTGNPKGVMLSYLNIFSHLQTFQKVFNYDERSILFNNLPLYHMDGLIQGPLITLFCGGTLIRPEKFCLQNLDMLFNKVASKKVSHVILVPSILALLDRYGIYDDYFTTPSCQMLILTAAYLNADMWARLQKRFQVKICNVYGLIETVTGGIFCGPDPTTFAIGTVGLPVDMTAKIVNELGEEQINGCVGELLLQGENVSDGYIGSSSESHPVFKDGWLYTGDLARKNAQGLIEIVGRKKEIIVSGGVTIYPEEINEVLLHHPRVHDAATFGIEDELWGDIPVAAVESLQILSESELLNFCRQYLEAEKTPKHIIVLDELPRGLTGKPLLNTLKTLAKKLTTPENINLTIVSKNDIIQLAAEVFKISPTTLSIHSTPLNCIAWDSLGHIKLIEAAEKRFQVCYPLHSIMNTASLLDLYQHTFQLLHYAN